MELIIQFKYCEAINGYKLTLAGMRKEILKVSI